MARRPRGSRHLLRPRGHERKGGPIARAARKETGLGDRRANRRTRVSRQPRIRLTTGLSDRIAEWSPHPTGTPSNPSSAADVSRSSVPMATPTIDVQQLWKSYDGKPALQGLFLDAYPGEILGLIGPNGAGKTTTIKILVGLLRPDYGGERVQRRHIPPGPTTDKGGNRYMPDGPPLPEEPDPH